MQRQQGFTLIEVVVAFAIFSLSVIAIYELLSSASRRSLQSTTRQAELLTAQSLLAQWRVRSAPWPSEEHGQTSDGLVWAITTTPYHVDIRAESAWQAFTIAVQVADKQDAARKVTLNSIELLRTREGISP